MDIWNKDRVLERTSRLERAYSEIRDLSERDALTGCYNRGYLETALLGELIKASRYHREISIIICDLDDFKRVNDEFGHQFGDETLKFFVTMATSLIRDRIDWLARYGGEEFVVVLPETDSKGAYTFAERLRNAFASTDVESAGVRTRVTASFGVATLSPDAAPDSAQATAFLHVADMQLYRAKQAGKNRVAISGVEL
jgi:two-component system, cell cycle response regulator